METNNSFPDRVQRKAIPVVDSQFLESIFEVSADGMGANVQSLSDSPIREATRDQRSNPAFALSQENSVDPRQ